MARIDGAAIAANYALLQRRASASRVLAVLKSDAYGHGIETAARALRHAEAFGVATQAEAETLRAAGFTQPIVLFGGFDAPQDIARLAQLGIRPAIHHPAQLAMPKPSPVPDRCMFIETDSGMNWLVSAGRIRRRARLRAMPNVAPDIVLMTHFAASDEPDPATVAAQLACSAKPPPAADCRCWPIRPPC